MQVHRDHREITVFPHPYFLLRFHFRGGCHCISNNYIPNKTKCGSRPLSLTLFQNYELESFCPNICVNFWLFKLFWTYCCCPWFPENVINCSKKKKRGISQEKYKHSAEICCGLFPQWSQRKLGFHPSDLFQGKNVPNPYNYILVSAFKKVKKKGEDSLPLPSKHEFQFRTGKESWYHCVIIVRERTIFNFLKLLLGGM